MRLPMEVTKRQSRDQTRSEQLVDVVRVTVLDCRPTVSNRNEGRKNDRKGIRTCNLGRRERLFHAERRTRICDMTSPRSFAQLRYLCSMASLRPVVAVLGSLTAYLSWRGRLGLFP